MNIDPSRVHGMCTKETLDMGCSVPFIINIVHGVRPASIENVFVGPSWCLDSPALRWVHEVCTAYNVGVIYQQNVVIYKGSDNGTMINSILFYGQGAFISTLD